MTDTPFPGGDVREAGLRAARLGESAEQNGDLAQAINLYRQSIQYLEQAGAPEAGQVWQRLTAAELKQKLEPVFQKQGDTLKHLIDRMADMSDEELATFIKWQAQQIDEHETGESPESDCQAERLTITFSAACLCPAAATSLPASRRLRQTGTPPSAPSKTAALPDRPDSDRSD